MHALDVTTGKERPHWPVELAGKADNSDEVLDPATSNQRPGLLLLGGRVYAATASYCDLGPYVGFLVGVDAASRAVHRWSDEDGSASSGAGIWQSGGGPMSDGPRRIFVATGNGVSPAPGPGTTPPPTLAESVVRLRVANNGTMAAHDYFSPANNAALDQEDADLGSGSPVGLPDSFGTPAHQHLLVWAARTVLSTCSTATISAAPRRAPAAPTTKSARCNSPASGAAPRCSTRRRRPGRNIFLSAAQQEPDARVANRAQLR